MQKEWIGCAPKNFHKGRSGFKPEAIVIHVICGSLKSCVNHFLDPHSSVSAHYGVGRDGRVLQFVEEEDTAFHAGVIVSPTWRLIKGGKNPNFYTIGIEHEGQPDQEWTNAQYTACAELVNEIAARWNIPLDSDHIVLHREIRASKTCPGSKFDRNELLRRIQAGSQPPPARDGFRELTTEVELIQRANVRSLAPTTQAPIARVEEPGTSLAVAGFTDQGQRVHGNANWYRTIEGNYVWAGATSEPNPVSPAPDQPPPPAATPVNVTPRAPQPVPAPSETRGAQACRCGVTRIDDILAGTGSPLAPGDPDREAVAVIQDLLVCQGVPGLPGLLSGQRGSFGEKTAQSVRNFQAKFGLPVTGAVDKATLEKLVAEQACDPRSSQAYLTLVLGEAFSGMTRVLSLTAQMEGVGKFGALNLNTDKAGLSYGLIQWAQRPGRLPEILKAFQAADSPRYVEVFGQGDAGLSQDLIAHVSRVNGGVNPKTGVTINPAFNLIADPWTNRFRASALDPVFQRAQVSTALSVFRKSYRIIQGYAPELTSERSVAFMLDVANQFGDAGTRNVYNAVKRTAMSEQDLLEAIADETVRRMPQQFKTGVRGRRDGFLHTTFLSDEPFVDG